MLKSTLKWNFMQVLMIMLTTKKTTVICKNKHPAEGAYFLPLGD